jgi:hypothetical protein
MLVCWKLLLATLAREELPHPKHPSPRRRGRSGGQRKAPDESGSSANPKASNATD